MSRILMIGAGGVATVAAFKMAQNTDVFSELMIASHHKEKCDRLVKAIHDKGYTMPIETAEVDADNVEQLKTLFKSYLPDLVVNLALPYQDLTIMEACLACGCSYLDTANYEPKDEAHFEYSWQWAYKEKFEQAGLTAILGCGFDPGVSGIYTAYAAKHYFDEIHQLDIVDCNAGNHHKAFATNFNPEINIREITQKGLYYKDGQWIETEPLAIHGDITYPNIGPRQLPHAPRGVGVAGEKLSHHQTGALLDDLRKAIPQLFGRHSADWHGTHRRHQLRSTTDRRPREDGQGEHRAAAIPQSRAAQPTRPGRELRRRDLHRLSHSRRERRQGAHLLRLQQLQTPRRLPRNRHAGRELHNGCARHDWRHDAGARHLEAAWRVECRGIRPRPIHGTTQHPRPALERGVRHRLRSVGQQHPTPTHFITN